MRHQQPRSDDEDANTDADVVGGADVVIVGYGPVGSVLAILLAQGGRRVEVLERFGAPYPLPRAVTFDGDVSRILQACGIGSRLAELSCAASGYEWRNRAGDTLLSFAISGESASGWPAANMFCQPELERALEARGAELANLVVRRGVEVTGLHQDDQGVTVLHSEGASHATYVVGCDGANSVIRSLIDAPETDLGFFYDWLICDVILDEAREFTPDNLQVCDPARPTTVVSGGPGRRRWEFMVMPGEDRHELDTEEVSWRLLEPWDVRPANSTLERHAVYTFQAKWVDEWRSGRVLLAGDAAHQMPPFAGQGMCSGVRDAANLAWKLCHVLDGRAGDSLLDTYEVERKSQVRDIIELSVELGGIMCIADVDAAAARDAAMIEAMAAHGELPIPAVPQIGVGLFDVWSLGAGVAGHSLIQGVVSDGTRTARFDDVMGAGWRLIGRHPRERLDIDLVEWFETLGGRIVEVGPTGDVVDVGGTYTAWLDERGADAVLQRPDFSVYGVVRIGEPATDLLKSLYADLLATVGR